LAGIRGDDGAETPAGLLGALRFALAALAALVGLPAQRAASGVEGLDFHFTR